MGPNTSSRFQHLGAEKGTGAQGHTLPRGEGPIVTMTRGGAGENDESAGAYDVKERAETYKEHRL